MHGSPGGFSSVLANPVFSFDSPSRSSASPPTPPVTASGATGDQQSPAGPFQHGQPAAQQHTLLQQVAQQQAQQAQEQHHWHVDVVLASHDAELAGVKEAVSKLEAAQDATENIVQDTSMHVASLDDRIRVLELGQPSFSAGGLSAAYPTPAAEGAQQDGPDLEATLSRGMGHPATAPDAAAAAGSADGAAAAAVEAGHEAHASNRIRSLEAASAKQQGDIEGMRLHTMQLQADLHQVCFAQAQAVAAFCTDQRVQEQVAHVLTCIPCHPLSYCIFSWCHVG